MYLKDFIKNKGNGYQSQIADITGTTYSKMGSMSSKLRKGKKLNSFELEIYMRGISILEGREYTLNDFQWQN